jgi:hypothetical protein
MKKANRSKRLEKGKVYMKKRIEIQNVSESVFV